MNYRSGLLTIILTFTILFCAESRSIVGQWQVVVLPDTVRVGDFGTLKLVVTIGDVGIKIGGAIKVQFPNGWYASPWPEGKLKNIQFTNPVGNHYAAVYLSRTESKARLSIVRQGIDGQHDRYGRSFVISIQEHPLLPDDKLTLTYANTIAPITSELQHIAVAVDFNGTGQFEPIKQFPALHILPGKPAQLCIISG